MTCPAIKFRSGRWVALGLVLCLGAATVRGQEAPPTAGEILQQFEKRLKALEEENRTLRDQMRSIAEAKGTGGASTVASGTAADPAPAANDGPADPTQGAPTFRVGETGVTTNTRGSKRRLPLKAYLGQGFELSSDDDEFQLQFHNETQVDYRLFDHTGQGTVHNGFFIPRQIWTFNGRMTKKLEFLASFQRGLSGFELRDALVNLKVLDEDRLMLKIGRYRVPFTYEFYAVPNYDLISPERSVFAINFSNIREIGAMAWGTLRDDQIDYAAGAFNGQRNSFEDLNDEPNFVGFLNARPFRHSERLPFLNYLNIGGSTEVGNQAATQAPLALRTSVNASQGSGASTASPAFLSFNNNVREDGMRAMGSLHAAWFYKRLSLLAEWDRGFVNYLPGAGPTTTRVDVPVDAYYVQAGFFLTGENVTRRAPIQIRKPFNLKRGEFGLGAVELAARYSTLHLGGQVFTSGLADPNLWSNDAGVLDLGFNWYINSYLKVYLDWQHTEFGSPVVFEPGRYYLNSELYWARLQFLF
ncbi:OprO/OprP family phosphate-selective porin [Paludisphaera mucosa]|uniref:Porin n=1 Tax=Paludisphaera mucosa TaxID=3030827 RepID=A0ABT6FL18_9BACT|nr:porin [Paludisphaera mucosa]MDG3008255.1 porin [Paludisphaera mucosa]